MFVFKVGVRYHVTAVLGDEEKGIMMTTIKSSITSAIRSSATLLLKGWTIKISGDDGSLYQIQPIESGD